MKEREKGKEKGREGEKKEENCDIRNCLAVQRLRFCVFTAGGPDSTPVMGTKIPQTNNNNNKTVIYIPYIFLLRGK